jgi:hypothetical protein
MSKIIVHFPFYLTLMGGGLLCYLSLLSSLWLMVPAWQLFCLAIMLILDGKNRMKRYTKIVSLCEKGISLDSLPRERTICGFFIRTAVKIRLNSA